MESLMNLFSHFITKKLPTYLIRIHSMFVLDPLDEKIKRILVKRFRINEVLLKQIKKYRKYEIGDWSYGEPKVFDWDQGATLIIGKYCSFGVGTKIFLGGEHRTDYVSTYPFSRNMKKAESFPQITFSKGDVIIGNDVWIGSGAVILSGVRIGNGAVIGARSVVVKDVAPYSISAGNPARNIRYRFDETAIEALQKIAWWNWPLEKIEEAWPLIISPNINEFIKKYDTSKCK